MNNDNIYCKVDYFYDGYLIFKSGKEYYHVPNMYESNRVFVIDDNEHGYVFVNKKDGDFDLFSDYFCDIKEVRMNKINKIDESR